MLRQEAYQDTAALAPADSYLLDAYTAYDSYFDTFGPEVQVQHTVHCRLCPQMGSCQRGLVFALTLQFILDTPLEYSEAAVVDEIARLVDTVRADECFLEPTVFTRSWIEDYTLYINASYDGTLNDSSFYEVLFGDYLQNTEGIEYSEDIWSSLTEAQDAVSTLIRRSRVSVYMVAVGSGTEQIRECLDNFERIQDEFRPTLGLSLDSLVPLCRVAVPCSTDHCIVICPLRRPRNILLLSLVSVPTLSLSLLLYTNASSNMHSLCQRTVCGAVWECGPGDD